MAARARSQSLSTTLNTKAQLNNAYNELGKELSDTKMRVVGNYNIGRVIGEGSFGKVRIGSHRLTSTRVAIKQIPKAVSAQLTREIHHHRQLHHPHIVQLYEVIATETSIWLITELCAGGELFDYLVEKGRIDELEARIIFGQLCLAVGYVHDRGAVHRDLKLENVLLDERCRVKLSDFGFTREYERGNLLETFCGTTGYASPEMLLGQRYTGQEVDIWSLGVILYALLTGTLPFDDDDEVIQKQKILAGVFDDPEWLSFDARDLIKSILVREPHKRPSIYNILSHSWFAAPLGYPSTPPLDSAFPVLHEEDEDEVRSHTRSPSPIEATLHTNRIPSTPAGRKEALAILEQAAPKPPSSSKHVTSATPFSSTEFEAPDPSTKPTRRQSYQSNRVPSSGSVPTVNPPPLPIRTPVRTKRRSVSSTISPPGTPKHLPSSTMGETAPDFLAAYMSTTQGGTTTGDLSQKPKFGTQASTAHIVFSTGVERELLNMLSLMGFDTAQIVHSVLTDACDSAGALWWLLRKKVGNGPLNLSERFSTAVPLLSKNEFTEDEGGEANGKDSDRDKEKDRSLSASLSAPDLKNGIKTAIITSSTAETEKAESSKKSKSKPKSPPKSPIQNDTPPPATSKNTNPTSGQSNLNIVATATSSNITILTPPTPTSSAISTTSVTVNGSTSKPRSNSISMLQRAQTVLGVGSGSREREGSVGGLGLGRKKSEEPLRAGSSEGVGGEGTGSDRGNSGGKLTKSPPPGYRKKDRSEDSNTGGIPTPAGDVNMSPWVMTPRGVANGTGPPPPQPSFIGSHQQHPSQHSQQGSQPRNTEKGSSSIPKHIVPATPTNSPGDMGLHSPFFGSSGSKGSGTGRGNRASILRALKTWLDDGRKSKKKAVNGNLVEANIKGLGPTTPPQSTFLPSTSNHPVTATAVATAARYHTTTGTSGRRRSKSGAGKKGHKDKRPSISSRRSSSVNSRRSSIVSVAPSVSAIPGSGSGLGAVKEDKVENFTSGVGLGLSRSRSDASWRSIPMHGPSGVRTPISEDTKKDADDDDGRVFEEDGEDEEMMDDESVKSLSSRPMPARRGGKKRHSKGSSTSSADGIGPRNTGGGGSRPSSRAGAASPMGRYHRRAGSSGSQTRVVRHHVKKASPSPSSSRPPASHPGHGRSGSASSIHSMASSADMETLLAQQEENLRNGSPTGKRSRSSSTTSVLVAHKKSTPFGAPSQGLAQAPGLYGGGSTVGRSSWKKAWGVEPPGWSSRSASHSHGIVIETVVLDGKWRGNVRDVFAKGRSSTSTEGHGGGAGAGAGHSNGFGSIDDGDEDDWVDEDDDVMFAGGLGQPAASYSHGVFATKERTGGATPSGTVPSKAENATSLSSGLTNAGNAAGRWGAGQKVGGGSPVARSTSLPTTNSTGMTMEPSSSLVMDRNGMGGRWGGLPGAGRSGFNRGPAIVEEEEEEEE